jgi:nicotinamidase-related amidase
MPNEPVPQEVAVEAKTTALLVLDLNCRCEDPKERCYQLIEPVGKFLDRARQANMFILYTAADRYKGTPEARMPAAFKQRADEPTIFPPAFDKFYSGEMQPMLQQRGIKTVICCGASSNQAVMYTATAAVRPFGYTCVIRSTAYRPRRLRARIHAAPVHDPPRRRRREVSNHGVR